ncbi:hypothetical protein [Dactylosporangium cerinum]
MLTGGTDTWARAAYEAAGGILPRFGGAGISPAGGLPYGLGWASSPAGAPYVAGGAEAGAVP